MVPRTLVGKKLPERSIDVEMYPLRFFAKAIGANDPIHHDHAAAIAAGYRSLLAPPTYVACLANMADPDPYSLLNLLNADPKYVLHGEQRLTFQQPICAGDRLYFNCHIADIYDKKNGALEFVVLDTVVTDPHHATVAEMRAVMIVRHPS